jgi:predicted TIM-barrel fold metal-dependent hydrolase
VQTPADDFVRLAEGHPDATFILAHWGGMLALADPRFQKLKNVYYDTAASPLLYDHGVWGRALAALGNDRVLFGSDFPLNLYPRLAVEAEMERFVAEAKAASVPAAVLGDNARRILRL